MTVPRVACTLWATVRRGPPAAAAVLALLLVLAVGLPSASGSGPEVVDEVHYTFTGATSVAFDWRGSARDIRYGGDASYGTVATDNSPAPRDPVPWSSSGPFREVELKGLAPGTTYHYSIGGGPDHTFTTAPTGDFHFAVEADIGSSRDVKMALTQADIAAEKPAFVLAPGDLTYADQYGRAAVDRHFNDVMAWSQTAAYMPAWGNHEWPSSGADDLRNYKERFDIPNGQTSRGATGNNCCGEDWGWFDAGGVRFISYPEPYSSTTWTDWQSKAKPLFADASQLDSNIRFIVTFGHRPAYSTGAHAGDSKLASILNGFGDTYPKYVLNLNGHSHNYERFQPIHGVTHITTGGGGEEQETTTTPTDPRTVLRAIHMEHLDVAVSSTQMKIDAVCGPASANDDFSCARGSVIDSVTIDAPTPSASGELRAPPVVRISSPSNDSVVSTTTPTFRGTAGTEPGDAKNVTVDVYNGPTPTGTPVSLPAVRDDTTGAWSVTASPPLLDGSTYTVQARQATSPDRGTDPGRDPSSPVTFRVDTNVDAVKPSSSATPPSSSTSGAITVPYTASDTGAGVASVQLYVQPPGAKNGYTLLDHPGSPDATGSGSFAYQAASGNGTYSFYTIAVDRAGNREDAPATADATMLVQRLPPGVPSISSPASGSFNNSGILNFAGMAQLGTELTVLDETGSAVTATPTDPAGTWATTVANVAEGVHSYRAKASDAFLNSATMPSQTAVSVTVDLHSPASQGSASPYSRSATIPVTYTAQDEGPGGLDRVELWVQAPGTDAFTRADADSSLSGAFSYSPTAGDGPYAFYTVAVDKAGNREPAAAAADTTTLLDTGAPSSTASAPQYSGSTTITVDYATPDAGAAALDAIELWAKAPGDLGYSKVETDLSPTASGSFSYLALAGDGPYSFYTIAVDKAGNREPAPAAADAMTLLDTSAASSTASSPQYSNSTTITVGYTASDAGSGLDKVELWAKAPGDGGYGKVATDATPNTSGSFSYTATAGDGGYSFYTVAVDTAGNREGAPATPDTTTLLDTSAPGSSASAPQYSSSTTITVGYTASDAGSGVDKVELWAKAPGDSGYGKVATDSTRNASGSFSYTAAGGDGSYTFYTVAIDTAGNREPAAAAGDTSTLLDTGAPSSTASSPQYSSSTTITVGYTASDLGSGLDAVELWSKAPGDSGYSKVATDSTPNASGSFAYTAGAGDGPYDFYAIAVDKAGNREPAPAPADTTTLLDTSAPSSTASAPQYSTSTTIAVGYTASDAGSGVDKVELWAKAPGDGGYGKVATDTTPTASGSFAYTAAAGDGPYSFYTVAVDTAGSREPAPATVDTTTLLDTGAPSSTASAPQDSNSTTITVGYTASDLGSGLDAVELWAKAPGESSYGKVANDTTASASGRFAYTAVAGDGPYRFYTVAVDKAGNREPAAAAADTTTLLDTGAPTSTASAPQDSNSTTITVDYTASDAGSGAATVELWAKAPGDGGYAKVATDTTPTASGSFNYTVAAGDGPYAFYTLAVDKAGNREAQPGNADATTTVDTHPSPPPAVAPSATTGSATAIDSSSAALGGAVNPHGQETTYLFEFGATTAYGLQTEQQSAGSSMSEQVVSTTVTALAPATTYHYRIVAKSEGGTVYGGDATFTTPAAPAGRHDPGGSPTPVPLVTPTPSPGGGGSTASLVASIRTKAEHRFRAVLRTGIPVTMSCSAPCTYGITAQVDAGTARKLGLSRSKKPYTLSRARSTLGRAGSARVLLKLTARAKRRITRLTRVKLKLTTAVAHQAGSDARVSTTNIVLRW